MPAASGQAERLSPKLSLFPDPASGEARADCPFPSVWRRGEDGWDVTCKPHELSPPDRDPRALNGGWFRSSW